VIKESLDHSVPKSLRSYFIIFAIAAHSFEQFRQDFAHAAICLSSGNFSHAAAQSLQHFTQHSQA